MINSEQSYKQLLNEVWSLMDRLCETTLLLEAMSLDQIYAAHYSKGKRKEIPEDIFYKIAEADPTRQGDGMGKYTDWMIRLYRKGNLKMEDLYKATQYLETFHNFKNRIGKKDIGQYKTLPELYDVVKPFIDNPGQATSKSDEIRRIKADGSEVVYEDERWKVVVPHTKEAAIAYGENTQWCTAASRGENMFDYYNEKGRLYININRQSHKKYQFHFESEQFMDENDEEIEVPIGDAIGLTDGLKHFYLEKYGAKAVSLLGKNEFINYCKRNGIDYIKNFIEDGGPISYLAREINGHFDIPNMVTKIGKNAFCGCGGLTSITIPNSVTKIGKWIFMGCNNLTLYVSNIEQYEHFKAEQNYCDFKVKQNYCDFNLHMVQDRPVQTESRHHGIMMEALEELLRDKD